MKTQIAASISNAWLGVMQKVLCFFWCKVYRRWLWNDFHQEYDKVIFVKGWRTALVETKCDQRRTMTPIFWCFK